MAIFLKLNISNLNLGFAGYNYFYYLIPFPEGVDFDYIYNQKIYSLYIKFLCRNKSLGESLAQKCQTGSQEFMLFSLQYLSEI